MTAQRPSKSALRQEFLVQRAQIPAGMQKIAAELAFAMFFSNVNISPGAIIAGYWPVRAEIDDMPILREALRLNHLCALPHIAGEGQPLAFRAWNETTPMVSYKYGIMEPAVDRVLVPDIVIVPLAAFDKRCHRLGYGAGFYDRTLARLKEKKKIFSVGIAYESQIYDEIPVSETDMMLDMVVTDRNVYKNLELK